MTEPGRPVALEPAVAVGRDRGIERRGEDPLVLCEQVVGELVEVADPADHRGRGDDLIDVGRQLRHQPDVLRVALDEPVARVVVVRLRDPAVLAEVVQTDDLVTRLQQVRDEIAADEAGRPGDENLQSRIPSPSAPQISTTSRPAGKRSPL